MDCSTLGLPVHHQLPEFTHTHVHRVSDAIQPSHPLSSPSPPAFSLSQHQGLFQWVNSLHQVAKLLEHQLQHQSFQGILRTNFLYDWLFFFLLAVQGTLKSLLQHHSSKASVLQCSASFWSNFHIHTWLQENHSFDYMDLCWQSNVSLFNMLSNQIISFLKSSLTLKSALLINLVIPQLEDFLLYLFTF